MRGNNWLDCRVQTVPGPVRGRPGGPETSDDLDFLAGRDVILSFGTAGSWNSVFRATADRQRFRVPGLVMHLGV